MDPFYENGSHQASSALGLEKVAKKLLNELGNIAKNTWKESRKGGRQKMPGFFSGAKYKQVSAKQGKPRKADAKPHSQATLRRNAKARNAEKPFFGPGAGAAVQKGVRDAAGAVQKKIQPVKHR